MRTVLLVTLCVLLCVSFAAAKGKRSLTLITPGTVNGVELQPGSYWLETTDHEVVFFQGKKEVTRAPMHTEPVDRTDNRDMVRYERGVITRIRTAGSHTALILDQSSGAGGAAASSSSRAKSNPE